MQLLPGFFLNGLGISLECFDLRGVAVVFLLQCVNFVTEYQTLRHEIDALQKENDRYTAQVKALQTDPKTIEKEAREQLHYARPGEIVYVAPAVPPVRMPALNAAEK